MKVHLNQIPSHGLHIEGVEEADILELNSEELRQKSGIEYSLEVGVSDNGLFATGTLRVLLDLECVSCLTRFDYPLEISDFALQVELDGRETVDLTPYIREDIVLALPPYPRCDWQGERACKGLKSAPVAAPEKKSDAWGALDSLKIQSGK